MPCEPTPSRHELSIFVFRAAFAQRQICAVCDALFARVPFAQFGATGLSRHQRNCGGTRDNRMMVRVSPAATANEPMQTRAPTPPRPGRRPTAR
jgi:hypothetical protein